MLKTSTRKGADQLYLLVQAAKVLNDGGHQADSEIVLEEAKQLLSSLSSQLSTYHKASHTGFIASIELDNGKFDEAEQLAKQGLSILDKYLNEDLSMQFNRLMARVKFAQGKPEQALVYLNTAIEIATKLDDNQYLQRIYTTASDYYEQQGQYQQAAKYVELAKQAAQRITVKMRQAERELLGADIADNQPATTAEANQSSASHPHPSNSPYSEQRHSEVQSIPALISPLWLMILVMSLLALPLSWLMLTRRYTPRH